MKKQPRSEQPLGVLMSYVVIRNAAGIFMGVSPGDGVFVPNDPGSQDYQAFLLWNAAQQPPLDVSDQPPADQTAALRSTAVTLLASPDSQPKLLRALMLVVLDEINALRANAGLTARTMNQLKTAIVNKINAGSADS